MPLTQTKAHEIETQRSLLPSFTVAILLMMVASIVLLGVLGDGDPKNKVHAKDAAEPDVELGVELPVELNTATTAPD